MRINNENEIDSINEINGIPIEEIEDRSKKIDDNTEYKDTYRYRSFDGFLGDNEKFKERLHKDWQLIKEWNKFYNKSLSHQELSGYLSDVIRQCENERLQKSLGPMTPIRLNYQIPETLVTYTMDKGEKLREVQLEINKNIYNGFQYSLFYNTAISENDIWNQKWSWDYKIKNLQNQIEITVSGSHDKGILIYIKELGFYEGDESNTYRIDPMIAISLLNGVTDQFTTTSFKLQKDKQIYKLNSQILLLQQQIKPENKKDHNDYLQFEIQNLLNNINKIQEEVS
ncbi:hypothetical protein DLAC_05113 [Tieghemostelium lacteum]|uniref:Uncharacterized protein n=1 Tax=Tieghemostelium lacteum TaxID=361077 RepID=A0A151ZIP9_TIELA|nr:hypothetical protein DLAC_05113 [Tieghemostelium lacteum]|eukprot:KYQ93724.1 hypothetical protein DLAC_05113 [Tieghemostelium lacteum]